MPITFASTAYGITCWTWKWTKPRCYPGLHRNERHRSRFCGVRARRLLATLAISRLVRRAHGTTDLTAPRPPAQQTPALSRLGSDQAALRRDSARRAQPCLESGSTVWAARFQL